MAKLFIYEHNFPVVQTTGGSVHGYVYDGVTIFKGIPYARAERFEDPHPVSWDGMLEATGYGFACPTIEGPALNRDLDSARKPEVMGEDCQDLNIWTPGTDGGARPVMVWLHGGAMSFGSAGGEALCEGEEMARHGDVVVVSLNHRLNILGFCDLSDFGEKFRNSGNQGIADMVAALRWVRDNIRAFGGDPGNVTLFGQSGGGMKVTALLQSPAADGLYHKGIIISGVQGGAMWDCEGSGKKMVEILMRETGCRTVEELQKIPVSQLMKAGSVMRKEIKFRGHNAGEMPFRSEYYLGDPAECPFRPETSRIPLMVGSTFGEFDAGKSRAIQKHRMTEEEMILRVEQEFGKELAAKVIPLFRKAYPERPLVDAVSMDYMFRSYIRRYMNKRVQLNKCTWEYIFNQDMPMLGGVSPQHGNDLGFFFHTTEKAPAIQEPGVTEPLESLIFESTMAFVRTGDPNHEGMPEWRPSAPGEMNTFMFDSHPEVRVNFDQELNDLLAEEALPKQVAVLYEALAGRLQG